MPKATKLDDSDGGIKSVALTLPTYNKDVSCHGMKLGSLIGIRLKCNNHDNNNRVDIVYTLQD